MLQMQGDKFWYLTSSFTSFLLNCKKQHLVGSCQKCECEMRVQCFLYSIDLALPVFKTYGGFWMVCSKVQYLTSYLSYYLICLAGSVCTVFPLFLVGLFYLFALLWVFFGLFLFLITGLSSYIKNTVSRSLVLTARCKRGKLCFKIRLSLICLF